MTYSIQTEFGNELCGGFETMSRAKEIAQRKADTLELTLYVVCDDPCVVEFDKVNPRGIATSNEVKHVWLKSK